MALFANYNKNIQHSTILGRVFVKRFCFHHNLNNAKPEYGDKNWSLKKLLSTIFSDEGGSKEN